MTIEVKVVAHSRAAVPTSIRGMNYRSQYAAAKALGVKASTVFIAMERGTLDGVGLGRNFKVSIPVRHNDKDYPSIEALNRHLGFSRGYIGKAIREARDYGASEIIGSFGKITWK